MRQVVAFAFIVALSLTAPGCRTVAAPLPDSFVCAHCACFAALRTASAPILCDTLGRDTQCCMFE